MRTKGKLRLCNDGECPCLQIWTANHPVAAAESGEWGDSYPAIRLVGKSSFDMKAEPYIEHIYYGEIPLNIATADARHLVACWNAVEDAGGDPATLQAENKRLREALERLVSMKALATPKERSSEVKVRAIFARAALGKESA